MPTLLFVRLRLTLLRRCAQPREYSAELRLFPSFADRCITEWSAVLVPPAAGRDVDGAALEAAAAQAAREEIRACMDAAIRAM